MYDISLKIHFICKDFFLCRKVTCYISNELERFSKRILSPVSVCTLDIKQEIFSWPVQKGGTITAKLFQHTQVGVLCVSLRDRFKKTKKRQIWALICIRNLNVGFFGEMASFYASFLVSLILQMMLISVIYFTPSKPKVTTVYFNERPKCSVIVLLHCSQGCRNIG